VDPAPTENGVTSAEAALEVADAEGEPWRRETRMRLQRALTELNAASESFLSAHRTAGDVSAGTNPEKVKRAIERAVPSQDLRNKRVVQAVLSALVYEASCWVSP